MRSPRYVVATCTGYKITPRAGSRGGRDKPGLSASVLDTWYCHREVARFCSDDARKGRFVGGKIGVAAALANAHALAASLNGE